MDNSFTGGLSSIFSGQKGNFAGVGKELGSSLTMGMQQQFGMAGGMASSLATALGPVGIAATVAGAGVLALGAAAVSTAKNWQTLMTGVSKTTGIEGAELAQLSATLQNIRMQTGATAEAISGAVVTAGSIGIPKEELASFAQLSLQMSSAFGMSADSAAMAMGQIGNVAKPAEMSWTEFTTRAGSSVNVLADTMATSEEQILTGMQHLGATMGLLKPPVDTLDDWQALVATVQSLGLKGDTAGEAIQDAMQYATKDAKNAISNLLGVSSQELQLNLRSNAPEVMMEAARAIAALPLDEQGAALAAFGQTGGKAIALLMGDLDKATGDFTLLGKAIDSSSSAWSEGTSLSIAYKKSQESLDAALSKLSASLDVTGQKIGTVMLPMITSVVGALNAGVVAANEFAATTLPVWAQSTTDWVNETLGMEEDTPEEIAERKAKIARTAEKTVTKVADTTGYQSYAEAQASAANLGKGTGNSYVDGLNSALDTGLPKALTDAYLGDALKVSTEAAKAAGGLTGEEWVKAYASGVESGFSSLEIYNMEKNTQDYIDQQELAAKQRATEGTKTKFGYSARYTPVFNADDLELDMLTAANDFNTHTSAKIRFDAGDLESIPDLIDEIGASFEMTDDQALALLASLMNYDQVSTETLDELIDKYGSIYSTDHITSYAQGLTDLEGHLTGLGKFVDAYGAKWDEFEAEHGSTLPTAAQIQDQLAAWKDVPYQAYLDELFHDFVLTLPVELRPTALSMGRDAVNTLIETQKVLGKESSPTFITDVLSAMSDPTISGFVEFNDKIEKWMTDGMSASAANVLQDSYFDAIEEGISNTGKFISNEGDNISSALHDILQDGFVSATEENALGNYIEELEQFKFRFPAEFDDNQMQAQLVELEATKLGIDVELLLGTDKLESDFYKWAEENANVISTYLANNTSYMEATEGRPEYQWLELNPDAVSLMEEYNAALSSHDPKQVSQLPGLQADLMRLHPELIDQAFWTTKVNVAQAELNEHFVILGNTVVGVDKDGKAVSEGFQAELPVLAAHGTGLITDAEAVASHTRSVLSSIAAMSNVHYGTLPTSANYALPGTTTRAYNAYKPTTPRYAPLESLNLTKFAKGGISLTKGIAEVDANELHIPKDQLPCAVSSMYDVLENPNLFFPSGLGTITDGSGATYPTQAKLESLGKVIDTTKISFESANSGVLELSSGATYVSDRWMEEYDRFTISPPNTGFQSSSKRGYVPVSISDAAKENIIYNPFTDESNWSASGMDAKIFAMQQQYAGKSSVMPSGANAKPDWIVEASNGVIPKYSEGVLNSLAVEYDSLQAVNTEKVRYADLQGTELRNILMQSDAIESATAANGEYCEAMSQFGLIQEENARLTEKNGMFQKSYFGPNKYYDQAKEYFAGNTVTEAIDKTTKQVSDVEEAVDDSASEYGKYGRKLDALTDGLFATVSVLRGGAQSDLYGDKIPMSQSAKWYMDEFYTVEYGLGQCVSYLSDFAIMQEGVFSDVLFKPSYIGKTAGYAGAGKGGLPGYSNIAEILPQNALEMQRAVSEFADVADMTDANYQLSKIGESSEATKEATEQSAKELKEVSKNTQQVADQNAAMSDLYGQTVGGSSGWGGTSIGGGGGWIGTSGVYSGMNGSVYYGSTVGGWGAQASNSISGNTGTVSIGQGAMYYAEGGITDHPVYGVFGEAGREAFVPISDRAAGRRILPQVMKELGVRTFATGGIAGSGGLSAIMESIGPTTITYAPTINADGLSKSQAQSLIDRSQDKFLEKVAKKQVLAKKRRG